MDFPDGLALEQSLIDGFVECGRVAHSVAQAHHNDPGSNGHTFGNDRYHRATEIAAPLLRDAGFNTRRRGAGLIATRDDIELQFAVARGPDLNDPANFDADSSPARRQVGATNQSQLTFPGMPAQPSAIYHVVWSGDPQHGLTAVHIGRLALGNSDRLGWHVLARVDRLSAAGEHETQEANYVGIADQPEPTIILSPRVGAEVAER